MSSQEPERTGAVGVSSPQASTANQNAASKTTQSQDKMDVAIVPHPLPDLTVHHTLSAVRRQPLLCSPLPRLPVFVPRPSSSAAPQHADSRLPRHVTEPGLTLSLQLTPFIQQPTSKHYSRKCQRCSNTPALLAYASSRGGVEPLWNHDDFMHLNTVWKGSCGTKMKIIR